MQRRLFFSVILTCAMLANCDQAEKKIAHNPIQTALGELTEMKLIQGIQVNDNHITSAPGERLLLLKFQGKTEIPYQSAGNRDNYYVIVDSMDNTSHKYLPIFVGAYDSLNKLSDQLNWKMNGTMTVRDGRTVFSGTIELTHPEVVLLYQITAEYNDLYLCEHGKKYLLLKK